MAARATFGHVHVSSIEIGPSRGAAKFEIVEHDK